MIDSIKNMFKDETEYFETEELDKQIEESTDDTFKVDVADSVVSKSSKSIVKIYEPVTKTASATIIDSIKRGELCIVNLTKVSDEESKIIYSTLSGSIYSLDGVLKLVDENIIVCAPRNYLVDGDVAE